MLQQLAIGIIVICLTTVAQILCIGGTIAGLRRIGPWLNQSWALKKFIVALSFMALSIILNVTICTGIWAAAYLLLDVFDAVETAVYFSIVSFTTLGFGDIILEQQWRLLSGLTASNGLIAFGLNTAFMVEVLSRLGRHEAGKHAS